MWVFIFTNSKQNFVLFKQMDHNINISFLVDILKLNLF